MKQPWWPLCGITFEPVMPWLKAAEIIVGSMRI